MTTNDPDQIRANIERTRSNLSQDVTTLAEQIKPGNVARRQAGKVGGAMSNIKEKVMGSASHATQAPHQAVAKAQGNPLAAGLVAFGAGMLLASLMPASEKERRATVALKEKAAPLKDEVTTLAKEAGENLRAPAQEAAQAVRSTAGDAVGTVRDEGVYGSHDVHTTAGHTTAGR